MQDLQIRAIREEDMVLLATGGFDEGTPEQPEEGLRLQRDGTGDFLMATIDGTPVGYLMLRWYAESHSPEEWKGDTAHLQDFVVLGEWRSKGIGTRMVRVAEEMARERGFRSLSLGVGVENDRARRLYERLGYRDTGLPPVEDSGRFRRWDGTMHEYRETWQFMAKELVANIVP